MDMHGFTLVYIYTNVLARVRRARARFWSFFQLSLKMAQKGSKKRKKAQKDSKRRSKRLFEPARWRQCARRGCSSLLRCRLCVRRGCSRLLFEITIRKCWARLHCALSHCTLLCFAPCMDMHEFILVYICGSFILAALPESDPFILKPVGPGLWAHLGPGPTWDLGSFGPKGPLGPGAQVHIS